MSILVACALIALGSQLVVAVNQPGYLITAPNRLIPKRPETVCIDLYNVQETTLVNLTLSTVWIPRSWGSFPEGTRNETLDSVVVSISPTEKTKCVKMTLPKFLTEQFPDRLRIDARGVPLSGSPDGFRFQDSMFVSILNRWHSTEISFIQTDKPIYKPGQLVRIRILTLDTRLRPSNDLIESVIIETPGRIRVEQWNNLTASRGMIQLQFQLHAEPEMGFYKIQMRRNGQNRQERFEVKEYVLPKYEVTLEPPKYITFQSEKVIAKVCAKYTFGQPVRGTLEASVCVKEPQWFFSHSRGQPGKGIEGVPGPPGRDQPPVSPTTYCTLIEQPLVDGCYTIDVTKVDVGYNRYTTWQWGARLEIAARVKEQGTGAYLNATTKTLYFQQYDIKLKLEGPTKFKPGLPYNAKVIATRLDGKPAVSEPIDIVINNWGRNGRYGKSYTTDANGEVKFSIPPVAQDLGSYRIQARAMSYNSSFWNWNYPSAYLSVEGWYSPSGSFLQIIPKTETLPCGSDATFKIQYTTNTSLNIHLHYQVVGLTDIAGSGKAALSLNLNTSVTEPDVNDNWDHSPRDPCFYRWWGCHLLPVKKQSGGNAPPREPGPPSTAPPAASPVLATHKGTVSLIVAITADMSTTGRLVVYYIRPGGEVVADGISFKVEECTANEASMTFSKSKGRPGDAVDIRFRASANSLCSYGIVDKSVFLEGGNNQLSLSKALSQIQSLALQEWSGVYVSLADKCGSLPTNDPNYYYYWSIPYKDASRGFKTAGLSTMTNLDIYTTPCRLHKHPKFRFRAEPPSSNVGSPGAPGPAPRPAPAGLRGQSGQAGAPGRDGNDGRSASAARNRQAGAPGAPDSPEITKTVRTYFPETWLWDLVDVGFTGAASVSSTIPDTITEWVGNAVCMSDADGIGISPAASLIGFQPFFVSMNLPYSVIRTEKVPIAVTVSNYLSKCMAVSLKMNPSTGYDIDGNATGVSCVCGQNTATRTYTIIMKEIGNINVSITAQVVNKPSACPSGSVMSSQVGMSDTVIRPVVVEPEGAPREYTVSDFVCMTRPDSVSTSGTAVEQYRLPLPGPSELVIGSERAYVKVVGDVMGPAMSNIDSLLRMPSGCAEQTMVSFAPNIFVMKYLEAINKDKPDLRAKAIQYMKSGYQRELRYAHNDQSYSSFGTSRPGRPGSMWLTAFVVKCFGLAQPYIYIDKSILTKSILFFTKYQHKDGCFPQIGTVHNKYMQGGFGQNTNGTNMAGLTAFVAIAMMEAGVETTDKSIVNAFQCIHRQTYSDAYTASIVAYAYSIFNKTDSRAVAAYQRLMNMAVVDGVLTMWKANIHEPPTPRISWWYYRPRSADTETTAYALLTKLNMVSNTNTKISEGLPIVRWLSTQRNPWGGFGSTQDTVIGLQALAGYAAFIYGDGLQASIRISEKVSNTQVASFELNNGNSFVEFTAALPRVTDLELRSTGKGCFLVQTNVRYNINKPDERGQPFQTTARVFRKRGSRSPCKERQLKICSRYLGEGGVSNMAIIEARMVSGWAADVSTLKALVADESVGLRRYEVDKNGAVQLYFDSLDRNQKCLTIDISQKFDVVNAKPAVVTTYDYYKTELRQELEYRIFPCTRRVPTDRILPIHFF